MARLEEHGHRGRAKSRRLVLSCTLVICAATVATVLLVDASLEEGQRLPGWQSATLFGSGGVISVAVYEAFAGILKHWHRAFPPRDGSGHKED